MRKDIHPSYEIKEFACSCGVKSSLGSSCEGKDIRVNVCSACHPYYTGKKGKYMDIAGRVDRFKQRQKAKK